MRFEYIHSKAEAAETALYCRLFKVTPQGYKKHIASMTKPYKYAALLADIKAVITENEFNRTYGKQRMYEELQLNKSCRYSYNTVAKVMRMNGLLKKPNGPKGLTKTDKQAQKSDNLLKRDFTASAPNQKTVTDIKEWAGLDGKVYASGMFDCYDNMCLGLVLSDNMQAEIVEQTFRQAAGMHPLRGAIAHSDRGSQYTSDLVRGTLQRLGIVQSMNGAAGRCHDNAKCESMWGRGESEISAIYNTCKLTCEELKRLLFRYYMGYWNNQRICSAIGGMPPALKRAAYYENQAVRAA